MSEIINVVRPYAEILHFVAGVGVAVVALYALRQLHLLKEDIRTRNTRAAREKAIEAANQYMREFIPLYNRLWRKMDEADLPSYEGSITDFDFDSLPASARERGAKRFEMTMGSNTFNVMEAIAAYFTSGIADEAVGFRIIGRTYCATVASTYDILSICHSEKVCPYYQNIVQLYRTWSARLSKEELNLAREELDKNISSIAEERLDQIDPNI